MVAFGHRRLNSSKKNGSALISSYFFSISPVSHSHVFVIFHFSFSSAKIIPNPTLTTNLINPLKYPPLFCADQENTNVSPLVLCSPRDAILRHLFMLIAELTNDPPPRADAVSRCNVAWWWCCTPWRTLKQKIPAESFFWIHVYKPCHTKNVCTRVTQQAKVWWPSSPMTLLRDENWLAHWHFKIPPTIFKNPEKSSEHFFWALFQKTFSKFYIKFVWYR